MVEIRQATAADLDRLVNLWLALSADGHAADPRYLLRDHAENVARGFIESEWIGQSDQVVLVADTAEGDSEMTGESGVVGFVTCRRATVSRVLETPVTYMIGDAYVTPAARRTGVATAMVDAAVAWAERQGARSVEVGTLANDWRAVGFWLSQGFGDWRATLRRDLGE